MLPLQIQISYCQESNQCWGESNNQLNNRKNRSTNNWNVWIRVKIKLPKNIHLLSSIKGDKLINLKWLR